jgi:glycosyltransferase involved in cell wall biosynthesis
LTTLAEHKISRFEPYKIAVLIPCYNEEAAVAKVIDDFRSALPAATIFVFDNNSTDNTKSVARAAGAEVFQEKHRGKGFVVRRMFSDVEADIYVLVDGDATYDAPSVQPMIERLLEDRLDMVVGSRVDCEQAAYRVGHRTGNKLLSAFIASVFGSTFNDVLSGYRVFSRRFVKSFPVLSDGFEIETELAIHAFELGLAVDEIDTPYYARPNGLHVQAQYLARRLSHSTHYFQSLPCRAPTGILYWRGCNGGNRLNRFRYPDCHDLSRDRPGAEIAYGRARDRAYAVGIFVYGGRPYPRYCDARSSRNETTRLSLPPCARPGAPTGLSLA